MINLKFKHLKKSNYIKFDSIVLLSGSVVYILIRNPVILWFKCFTFSLFFCNYRRMRFTGHRLNTKLLISGSIHCLLLLTNKIKEHGQPHSLNTSKEKRYVRFLLTLNQNSFLRCLFCFKGSFFKAAFTVLGLHRKRGLNSSRLMFETADI